MVRFKNALIIFVATLLFIRQPHSNWLSSAGDAFKSVASTAGGIASGAAKEALNIGATSLATGGQVSPGAVAELDFCRRLASIPGGTMSLEYQRRCGNMAMVCQQVRTLNPNATMDPYCATVSGYGKMKTPWNGSISPMIAGVNTTSTPQNTDPAKIGWSVSPPPPFGMTMGSTVPGAGPVGAYGVTASGAEGLGAMIAGNMISRYTSGGSYGYNNNRYGSGNRIYSADEEPE